LPHWNQPRQEAQQQEFAAGLQTARQQARIQKQPRLAQSALKRQETDQRKWQ
jgi:hypothetical protein